MLHWFSKNTSDSGLGLQRMKSLGALALSVAMSSSPVSTRAQTAADVAKARSFRRAHHDSPTANPIGQGSGSPWTHARAQHWIGRHRSCQRSRNAATPD